jgi:hypothetical protein
MSILTYFKYKIIEFAPDENMEKTFNKLGEDGWELVSVVPIGLKIEGYSDVTLGYGGGESSGKFEKIAAYFKKTM